LGRLTVYFFHHSSRRSFPIIAKDSGSIFSYALVRFLSLCI
jgi:hypothetical protein